MIHVVLVGVGAAAGSMVFIVAWQRRWSWRRILAANAIVCAFAGTVAGALVYSANESVVASLLSYGVLGTAAPFLSALLPSPSPRSVADAWRLIRRTCGVLAVNAVLCATVASTMYMLVAGGVIYVNNASP